MSAQVAQIAAVGSSSDRALRAGRGSAPDPDRALRAGRGSAPDPDRALRAGRGSAPDPDRAKAVLSILLRNRRVEGRGHGICPGCFAPHLDKVLRAIESDAPIHLVLPAFPAKSPSPRKVLGRLPDLAEERALRFLAALCEEIRAIHPPGARLTIASDGRVFADLVGVSAADVTAYGDALEQMIGDIGATGTIDTFREWRGTEPLDPPEIAKAKAGATLAGIERFLFEERLALAAPGTSRSDVRREARALAVGVVQRSHAWSRVVEARFPDAIRLSIHPQDPHASKLGICLGEGAEDRWLTPWHGAAVEMPGGKFVLMHRHEAEALGARLVEIAGKPSHLKLDWTVTETAPFGLRVEASAARSVAEIPVALLHQWTLAHRVVLLRGFAPLAGDAFLAFGRSLGPLLEWKFGAVNELTAKPDATNYLYTPREVPFHWDGAFANEVPRAILFRCDASTERAGGETLFCDTTRLLRRAPSADRETWEHTRIRYETEKIAHYGGTFTSPMLATHPLTGEPVLRFAEPVDDLNPVTLEIVPPRPGLLSDLASRLRDPEVCYAHTWKSGDVVIADNHALLHGRRAFVPGSARTLQRINVL